MARSTAEMRVGTREARTWKSRVNAVIRRVHLRLRRVFAVVELFACAS
jgi:hypothetical protein